MWTNTWTNFSDLDRTFAALDVFRRRFDRVADGLESGRQFLANVDPFDDPRFFLRDDGDAFVLKAVLPGIPANTLELTLTGQNLKLQARRKVEVPEGYVAHRSERPQLDLVRSFSLPTRVDGEKVTAEAKDGIVTITIPKAADVKPRSITVKTT